MRTEHYKRAGVAAVIAAAGIAVVGCSVPAVAAGDGRTGTVSVPAAPADNFTGGQRQAVKKAESYLRYSAFSRQGLIEQLQYEEFSVGDAVFAVDHVTVDWNEQAVKKAGSYLSYSAFSLSGLVEQLEYEGFTPEQARYGAQAAYNAA
jgi:formate-dependent nitrite reductase cytochrome c552 subunit